MKLKQIKNMLTKKSINNAGVVTYVDENNNQNKITIHLLNYNHYKPMPPKHNNYLLRIILSPLIFIWGCILLAAGTLFPIPLLMLISLCGLLLEPFIWLLRKSGSNIEGIEPFIELTESKMINHFIGLTIYIWGAFSVAYIYIKDGEIITTA